MAKKPNSEATAYYSRRPIVTSGISTYDSTAPAGDNAARVAAPAGGLIQSEAWPGGPQLADYGVDLNWVRDNAPSLGSAPIPESNPQEQASPFTTSTIGAPGTAIFSGFVKDMGEYNPKLDGRNAFWTYEKMRRSDADVCAAMLACKLPIRAADKQIVPGNTPSDPDHQFAKEIADFVRENLFGGLEAHTATGSVTSQTFESVEENALLMLDFGCSGHEDLWSVDQNHVHLRRMAPRLPLTYYRFWTEDDGETLLALEQYGYRKNQFVNVVIPAEKFCLFTHRKEGANFYGMSALRAAYQSWYIKSQLYRIDCIALERNGLGVPTFKMPIGFSTEDKQTAHSWATQLTAHENTGVALPPGWEFEITGIKGRLRDPWTSIRHHSELIVKAVLAMFLNLGTTQSGSRALGNTMTDFFFLGLEAVARNVAATINEQTIRRLVDYNFDPKGGRPLPYPKLQYQNIVVLNPLEVASAVKDLANTQVDVFQPDNDLEDYLRRKFGLPLKTTARDRFMPVQIREMASPAPGETIGSEESNPNQAGLVPQNAGGSPAGDEPAARDATEGIKKPVSKTAKPVAGVEPNVGPSATTAKTPAKKPAVKAKPAAKKAPAAKPANVQASDVELEPEPDTDPDLDALAAGGAVYKLLLTDSRGKTVCVDFDGVLSESIHRFDPTDCGALIEEGKQLVLELHRKGYRIVILTARQKHDIVEHFLTANGIPYDEVTNVKPPAVAYIDDKAVSFKRDSAGTVLRRVSALNNDQRT